MWPRSIELFTGAGGLALGVERAGFEHALLVERDHDACETIRANRHDWPLREADTRTIDFRPFADSVSLVAAGAPCQPFSLGGKHRAHQDSRDMFPEVFRVVRETRPEVVIIENVKGLLRVSFRDYFDYIVRQLGKPMVTRAERETWRKHDARVREAASDDLTYEVAHQLVNCADYGVPQSRSRVFIVAFRSDLATRWWPLAATHSAAALSYAKWGSGEYWRAHGREQPKPPRGSLPLALPLTRRWRTVRDALAGLPKPEAGRECPGIQNHVINPGARSYKGHTGSPFDLPAKTLKAGDHGCPGGENMLRYENGQVRYFTVREAARLQTFPDDYALRGAWSECLRQIGNAVPVEMGAAIVAAAWKIRCAAVTSSEADTARPSDALACPDDQPQVRAPRSHYHSTPAYSG